MTTRPACLLLDEPTNHLDDDAIEVLTRFLRDLPGVVVLASHDRVLLDDVCTDLVDLDPTAFGTDGQGGRRFGGGWSDYVAPARTPAGAGRRRTPTSRTSWTGCGRPRGSARRRSPTTGPDRQRQVHLQASRAPRSSSTLSRRKRDAQRRLDARRARPGAQATDKPLVFRHQLAGGDRQRPARAGPRPRGRGAAAPGPPRRRGGRAPARDRRQRLRASRRCSACWPVG